jgi:DNA-binding transcriptional LysR family regulator
VHHRTLALRAQLSGGGYVWRLQRKGETSDAALHPSVIASDPAPLLRAAADGGGIVMAGGPQVREAVAAGALQRVLPQWTGPRMQLFAFYPRERLVAPKMRAFIDFLVEQTAAHEDEIGGATG